MYKLVATWTEPKPEQAEEFEREYATTHVPLAAKCPELKQLVLMRTASGLEGNPSAFYRVAELIYEDERAFERCAESAEWQALRADAGQLIERFGVELHVGLGTPEDYPLP
jgi:uncharacterized protein (TIGR02118 family)